MALFDSFDWSKLIPAAASIFGANQAKDSADQAAQIAQNNATQSRADIVAANNKAVGMLQPQIDSGAPATEYFRTVMAQNPNTLTPAQQISLRDTTLAANRGTPTALRGSGRAVSAMINDTVDRAKAGMVQTNQARSDAAAGRLKSTGDQSLGQAAGITAGQGGQEVNINNTGADASGNAALVGGSAQNDALGNIAAYFANTQKVADRNGAYGSPKPTGIGGV